MADTSSFPDLIRRLRGGDADAVTELLRRYEPLVRRILRARLVRARLGDALSAADLCQSVFLSLWLRLVAGQYDVERPEQMEKLLHAMARNKLVSQVRRHLAQGCDRRRLVAAPDEDAFLAPGPSPSQEVADRELLREARRRMTPAELHLVELRHQGLAWEEIAVRLGGTPMALRQQLSRAQKRVTRELGLAGDED